MPATVVQVEQEIHLHRVCPIHGRFAAVINSDARHYYLSLGASHVLEPSPEVSPSMSCGSQLSNSEQEFGANESSTLRFPTLPVIASDAVSWEAEAIVTVETAAADESTACCSALTGSSCGGVENLSTCVALIEIVQSCNLECPVCFADSPRSSTVDALPFVEFCQRVSAVTRRKGRIDILQLSGGEPTIHPEFFRLLNWALANPDVGHVLLNTNGIKVTNERFFQQVAELRAQHGKLEIYLQYDGPQAAGQITMRGVDLRHVRYSVIQKCQEAHIPVNLAMTVDLHNRGYLGEALQVAIDHPWVSGITWQPMFGSGRVYQGFNTKSSPEAKDVTQWPDTRRLNVADIIAAAVEQSAGRLSIADFTPLPCGDPNCHTVAYLLRQGQQLVGLSALVDLPDLQGFLRDRLNYNLSDLQRCGCESEPLGRLLQQLELGPRQVLRLVIKPFMDAWTYDQHRVDRCCVHVIGAEGRLESFCRHYVLAGQSANR